MLYVLRHIKLLGHLMPNQVKKGETERPVMLEFISSLSMPSAKKLSLFENGKTSKTVPGGEVSFPELWRV